MSSILNNYDKKIEKAEKRKSDLSSSFSSISTYDDVKQGLEFQKDSIPNYEGDRDSSIETLDLDVEESYTKSSDQLEDLHLSGSSIGGGGNYRAKQKGWFSKILGLVGFILQPSIFFTLFNMAVGKVTKALSEGVSNIVGAFNSFFNFESQMTKMESDVEKAVNEKIESDKQAEFEREFGDITGEATKSTTVKNSNISSVTFEKRRELEEKNQLRENRTEVLTKNDLAINPEKDLSEENGSDDGSDDEIWDNIINNLENISQTDWEEGLVQEDSQFIEPQDYKRFRNLPSIIKNIRGKKDKIKFLKKHPFHTYSVINREYNLTDPNGYRRDRQKSYLEIKRKNISEVQVEKDRKHEKAKEEFKQLAHGVVSGSIDGNGMGYSGGNFAMGGVSGIMAGNSAVENAAYLATSRANRSSVGYCAKYVRIAIQSAGIKYDAVPSAYQAHTNGNLKRAGFVHIQDTGQYEVGDIMVWDRGNGAKHGHIQIWNGKNWVSDFIQNSKIPGRKYTNNASYLYRMPGNYNPRSDVKIKAGYEANHGDPQKPQPEKQDKIKNPTVMTPIKEVNKEPTVTDNGVQVNVVNNNKTKVKSKNK